MMQYNMSETNTHLHFQKLGKHLAEIGELVSEALYDILQDQNKALDSVTKKLETMEEDNKVLHQTLHAHLHSIEQLLIEKKAKKGIKSLFQ